MAKSKPSKPEPEPKSPPKRKHAGAVRVATEVLDRVHIAAAMMRKSTAQYVTDVLRETAERDIAREVAKEAKAK